MCASFRGWGMSCGRSKRKPWSSRRRRRRPTNRRRRSLKRRTPKRAICPQTVASISDRRISDRAAAVGDRRYSAAAGARDAHENAGASGYVEENTSKQPRTVVDNTSLGANPSPRRGCLNARSAGILPAGARASRSREWRGQDAHAPAGGTPALLKAPRYEKKTRGRADIVWYVCATRVLPADGQDGATPWAEAA